MSATPIEITEPNFQAEVVQAESPVLIDLWAAWCGPCRLVAPIVDEIADDYAGRIKVGKVDVDARARVWPSAFNALSIPTIVLVKDGEVVASAVGARPKAPWSMHSSSTTHATGRRRTRHSEPPQSGESRSSGPSGPRRAWHASIIRVSGPGTSRR